MVGYKLTKPSIFKDLYKKGWDQIIPFVITIAAILFTDLLIGILIGIVAGLFFVLRTNFKNGITFVSEGNYYLVRLRKDVSFLNKPKLKQSLESIPDDSKVIIDLSKSDFVDNDIKELIQDFRTQAEYRGISVEVKLGDRNIQI
jgi:MFS superfamily sulfate permease-like transporter